MEGSVRKVGNHRWRLVFDAKPDPTTKKRRQITRTVKARTKGDAQAELRRLIAEHGKVTPADHTVAELVARWFRHTQADLALRTVEERQRIWRLHVEPHLAGVLVADVGPAHLNDRYVVMREAGYKPATIIKVHALLSGAFTFAVDEDWIATNPAARARRPKQTATEPRIPDLAALAACLAEADRRWPEYGVLVRLVAATGMRRGEVCALRWTDIELDAGVIEVSRAIAAVSGHVVEKTTKTGKGRRFAIGEPTAAMLRRHRTLVAAKRLELGCPTPADGYVFPWTIDAEQPTHPSTVTHRWMACRDAVGAPTIRLHDLRHHSASHLVAAGTNLRTVMERHGWSSLATAQRYIHSIEAKDRDAADVLERVFDELG